VRNRGLILYFQSMVQTVWW